MRVRATAQRLQQPAFRHTDSLTRIVEGIAFVAIFEGVAAPSRSKRTPPHFSARFNMAEPVDVTQTAEYLELMQVSEEMEADLMRQLAEKDQVIAQQMKLSQEKIAQLEADLAGRDKELESYIEELEAANEAKMKAKDAEAAALKQALSHAEAKLQQPHPAAAVRTHLLRAEAARDVLVCD